MRLFVAIELDTPMRQYLARIQDVLRPQLRGVSFTPPENLHVTLKFLGEAPDSAVPGLSDALGTVRAPRPLTVSAAGARCFPEPGRFRIIGVGLTGDLGPLRQMQADIESACQACGFPREGRAFTPHLTLGRARNPLHERLREPIRKAAAESGTCAPMAVSQFVLMQSQLGSGPARYHALAHFSISPGAR
jgi:2'-5' RNA ligase